MRQQEEGIEPPGFNGLDLLPDPSCIDGGIAFMGIDEAGSASIPELHVDLPRSVLMMEGNDELPSRG